MGLFCLYGIKLHLLCDTNRVPISYEITSANVADLSLTRELLAEAELIGEVGRKLYGDLAYESATIRDALAEKHLLLLTKRAEQRGMSQQIELAFAGLKSIFGLEWTLAKTLTGLVTRVVAKIAAYAFGLYINRLLGRPQGKIKE